MLAWKSATPALSGYGYKIFRVDGGRHDLVVFVYNTWAALAKVKRTVCGACYGIVVYLGTLESLPAADSARAATPRRRSRRSRPINLLLCLRDAWAWNERMMPAA